MEEFIQKKESVYEFKKLHLDSLDVLWETANNFNPEISPIHYHDQPLLKSKDEYQIRDLLQSD